MSASHTPGPWFVYSFRDEGIDPMPGIDANGSTIVMWGKEGEDCGVRGDTRDQQLANARLIAAAPDLLEALIAMRTMMDAGPQPKKFDDALTWRENDNLARSLCDAAIAKAMRP